VTRSRPGERLLSEGVWQTAGVIDALADSAAVPADGTLDDVGHRVRVGSRASGTNATT
jgi:hypothetical protein